MVLWLIILPAAAVIVLVLGMGRVQRRRTKRIGDGLSNEPPPRRPMIQPLEDRWAP